MIAGTEKEEKAGDDAIGLAATIFKVRTIPDSRPINNQASSGCPLCSVYEALAKHGWMKKRTEEDYRDHLMARHGLEV